MKIFFGYLFLLLGAILSLIQSFSGYNILFIMVIITLGCILGASLAITDKNYTAGKKFAAGTAFSVSIILIIILAYQIFVDNMNYNTGKYFIIALYALAFGIYGFKGVGGTK